MLKFIFAGLVIVSIFSCSNKNEGDTIGQQRQLEFNLLKEITIEVGDRLPVLTGNPMFIEDRDSSYFFIQGSEGIGAFNLSNEGLLEHYLNIREVEAYMGEYPITSGIFQPLSKHAFLFYDKTRGDLYTIEGKEICGVFKVNKFLGDFNFLSTGFLKTMFVKDGRLFSFFGTSERYGGPPFKYAQLQEVIVEIDPKEQKSIMKFPLPMEYFNRGVNVHDLLITLDYDVKEEEFIVNFPVSDSIYITKDFEDVRKIYASPAPGFVNLQNRSGNRIDQWKKEYYTTNTFFTTYYDPYRELYVRHYRKEMSEQEFENVNANAYKMLDGQNKNYLLFLDKQGNVVGNLDVSTYNHIYVHFGKDGMYILNDVDLVNEDSLTFSLFEMVL